VASLQPLVYPPPSLPTPTDSFPMNLDYVQPCSFLFSFFLFLLKEDGACIVSTVSPHVSHDVSARNLSSGVIFQCPSFPSELFNFSFLVFLPYFLPSPTYYDFLSPHSSLAACHRNLLVLY